MLVLPIASYMTRLKSYANQKAHIMRKVQVLIQRDTIFMLLLAITHVAIETNSTDVQKKAADQDRIGRVDSNEDAGNRFYTNFYITCIYIYKTLFTFKYRIA